MTTLHVEPILRVRKDPKISTFSASHSTYIYKKTSPNKRLRLVRVTRHHIAKFLPNPSEISLFVNLIMFHLVILFGVYFTPVSRLLSCFPHQTFTDRA